MVAITVAIAATVYVYVSGMIGTGSQSTPTLSMTSTPLTGGTTCTVQIATVGTPNINWSAVTVTLNCVTNASAMPAADITAPVFVAGSPNIINGGDLVSVKSLQAGNQYTVTVAYKVTGGTMGTVSWNQV
jgi:FlaG/FlaF family flagellin (archaellin)